MQEYFLKNPRLGGLFLMLLSAAATYWQYTSIMAHVAANEKISLSYLIVLSVAMLMGGLMMLIFGPTAQVYSEGLKGRQKTPKDYAIIGVMVLPGFAAYFWIQHILEGLGYVFK
jgi:hypothetical protein